MERYALDRDQCYCLKQWMWKLWESNSKKFNLLQGGCFEQTNIQSMTFCGNIKEISDSCFMSCATLGTRQLNRTHVIRYDVFNLLPFSRVGKYVLMMLIQLFLWFLLKFN
jgi:hypothetical protein